METPGRSSSASYCFDDVIVDLENFRVLKGKERRALEPRAFNLLVYLIQNRGRVVEKQELFEQIWKETFVSDNALTRAINQIRRATGDDAAAPRYIETIPKRGYRFAPELKPAAGGSKSWEARVEALNYKILRKLDEGGGGVVYLARDIRLQRQVVLKLLSDELAGDEGARRRFLREARLASSLDHPNVCTIHEINDTEGLDFIVMQYVEGKSLRQILTGKPLDLDAAVSIAIQVAEGLAAAHAKNIVHRDIKPGNIMITNTGQVKILDFGLAK